jgi:predicted SnoaL-like aldol condensation-catalyzing enzyme
VSVSSKKAALAAALVACALSAQAQVPVTPAADQQALLAAADAKLAANKRLVYDFWRTVLEGGHMEAVDQYLAEGYEQHNPNVPSGRAGFVKAFSAMVKPKAVQPGIQAPLVSVVAERDLVVLSFASEHPDPSDKSKKYTTTWFDMFRVQDGRIVEHWDCDVKEKS